MSNLVAAFRPLWVPGVNAVTGKPAGGMPVWIANGNYQIYAPIAVNSALLSVATLDDVIAAMAADCARFTTAAIESIEGIAQQGSFPKSVAWLTIRSYYASFYAAHAILRVLGVSCTQFDASQTAHINDTADAFGMAAGTRLQGGLFECNLYNSLKQVSLSRIDAKGGSHIATWKVFLRELRRVINAVPLAGLPTADANQVVGRLADLELCLTDDGGTAGGSFLSAIRNRVNYRLELGAWFPYGERRDYYDKLFASVATWRRDPLAVPLSTVKGRDLQRLAESSVFLVSLAREMSLELVRRCPSGKSMQTYACISMLNQLAA